MPDSPTGALSARLSCGHWFGNESGGHHGGTWRFDSPNNKLGGLERSCEAPCGWPLICLLAINSEPSSGGAVKERTEGRKGQGEKVREEWRGNKKLQFCT